jgi:glycine betaine transporter
VVGSSFASGLKKFFGRSLNLEVFSWVIIFSLPFFILGGFFPGILGRISQAGMTYLTGSWDWFYLGSCSFFVFACLAIALSPLGRIRLGRDDERPEYSFISWFAMLFSAGMGIGLVFWACSEPMEHLVSPPAGIPNTPAAARQAFEIFYFHWGLHAWATYVVVGLPMAYFTFRKGRPAVVSACLPGRLGRGAGATVIDILAIWATIMGVVTSLGMGALQINKGLESALGLPATAGHAALIIAVITCLFIISALTGVSKGIKILSLLNVSPMILLLLFFFTCGPFTFIVRTFFTALGDYLKELLPLSTSLVLFDNPQWTRNWTVFYWAWGIAGAPFVGAFIAQISRGRTIREFILVVLVVPPLFSFLFSSALGGTAAWFQLFGHGDLAGVVKKSIEAVLFFTLKELPFYIGMVFFTNLLISSFFITSADSATYVISLYSTGGHPASNPGARHRLIIFWGMMLGGLAVVLIYSGGLKALQTASIVGAFPFIFVMYLLLVTVVRALIRDYRESSGSG